MTATLGENRQLTTALVLTQLLRLQQIVGGFLPHVLTPDEALANPERVASGEYRPIAGENPKMDALLEVVEESTGKFVIWAHFRAEIDLISRTLSKIYGEHTVREFHGGINDVDRTQARKDFQDPDHPARFFIAQTETGGIGITLTAAKNVIYYSNSFSLESRLQSEDRTHRIGQTSHVTYTDLVATKTIDEKLARILRRKLGLANVITGDNWKEWL
jgi:SNF2 family DNA or RNA helicase